MQKIIAQKVLFTHPSQTPVVENRSQKKLA
jgi:hypothetical protein